MSAKSIHHARVVGRDGSCVLRQILEDHECEPDTRDGRVTLQAAHVPPQSATKEFHRNISFRARQGWEPLPPELRALAELTEDELVADGDLGLTMCKNGHHNWDYKGDRCRRDRLPTHVERRCRELGLTGLLDERFAPAPGQPDLRPIPLRKAAA